MATDSDAASRQFIGFRDEDDVKIVTFLEREMGIEIDTELLDEQFREALDGIDQPKVLINMSDLAYMSSKCIGALINFHKVVWQRGGQVKISNVPDYVMETFRAAKLHHLFEIHPIEEEALASFD